VGGDLAQYIGLERFRKILHYTDDIYVGLGADKQVYGNEMSPAIEAIHRSASQAHMKLIDSGVRHIGTERAYEIYSLFQKELERLEIDMLFDMPVQDFLIEVQPDGEKKATGVILQDGRTILAGRVGGGRGTGRQRVAEFHLQEIRHRLQVGPVDIGLRSKPMPPSPLTSTATCMRPRLVYYTPTFEDRVRTFCWNPRGEVAEEKYGSLAVVNGHSYKDEALKSGNTNFALLVSKNFTQPFKTPIEYGRYIAELGNMLSGSK